MVEPRSGPPARRAVRLLLALLVVALASCTYENTLDVPGDVNRFDPVTTYPAIAAAAGGAARLVKLEARFVREDGTQDLEASYVTFMDTPDTYTLVRASGAREDTSAPVGARKPVSPEESVAVTVQKPHWLSVSRNGHKAQSEKHRGMEIRVRGGASSKDAVTPPACAFAKIWAAARQHGAPKGAVAAITYDRSGYEFHIDGTPLQLRFDAACRLVPEVKP